jgi:hypothetical protein
VNVGGITVNLWKVVALVVGAVVVVVGIFLGFRLTLPKIDDEKVKSVQAALASTKNAGEIIAHVHDEMNGIVGWNGYEDYKDPESKEWATWELDNYPQIKYELREAQDLLQNGGNEAKLVLRDLDNAIALLDVAKQKHEVTALLYLHRIVSDLGQFAYGHYTDRNPWGYTYTLDGKFVPQVVAFLNQEQK